MQLKKIGFLLGPIAFVILLLLPAPAGLQPAAWKAIALAVLMLTWYISEAMPLPVTALLPMVLLPLLGLVTDMKKVFAPYADPVVYLFMGGFVIALAMECWHLHRRIALNILKVTGVNANGIIFGFFLSTALISMWISNTATTMMMLPIALSVVGLFKTEGEELSEGLRKFALSLMLGVSYASSIGGVGTIIGSPPNVVFVGQMKTLFHREVSFLGWMAMGVPYALLLLVVGYAIIVYLVFPNRLGKIPGARERIAEELANLGPMSDGEKLTLLVFVLAAMGWIFKLPIEKMIPGLKLDESIVAVGAAILLFITPVNFREWKFVLEWKNTEKLPWGILLLFGGGLSLAGALSETGIIGMIGQQFTGGNGGSWLFILALVSITVFLTELLSNVALVTVFVPVMGAVAQGMNIDPILLCLPVTLAASSGFMLPMSTPPNAIVFASGHVSIQQMMRAGFYLNIVSIILMTLFAKLVIPFVV
jgi:sodium-dependent dicarboxylate transporter 2/3/5